MVRRRRVSFCLFAAALLALATLATLPAKAAVTTYTGTFSGTIAAGDTALLTGTASVSGNVANSGTLQFNITGSSAVANNAIISGTGVVRMTGSGTVTNLFDAQTYTGATRLENGTLLVNYNDRLGNASSGVTFDGGRLQITNSGVVSTFSTARSMSLVSAGTIDTSTLADGSYDQPAFTGVVSGTGTLTLAAHGLGNGASDAYLRFGGASTYSGTTRITSGMVYASSTAAFGTSTVVLDGGGLVAPSAVTVNNAIFLAGTANFVRPWSSQTMNLGGAISGTGGLQKTDNGTVNLNAANTYTGDTRILAGTLNAANYAALAGTTLDMNSGDAGSIGFTVAQTGTYQIGGLSGSRNLVNGGDTLAIGGNDTSTTYSGTLSGAGGLIKNGAGTFTLTGSNSYAGGTVLQGGALALGSAGAIGSSGTISFTGGALQYSASNTTDYSSRFSTAAGQDYSIDTNGQNVTLATRLESAGGSLTKLGAGVLNLTGTAAPNTVVLDFTTNVSAGTLRALGFSGDLMIGNSGTGTLNVSGGLVSNGRGYLGYNAGSVGTATVSSGTWGTSGSLYVGYSGTGTLDVSGGRVFNSNGYLGSSAGGVGTATVSSGTWANDSDLTVGGSGSGTLNVTGGRVTNLDGYLGYSAGSFGTATVSSGTWASTIGLTVGFFGSGTLNVTGGSVTNNIGYLGKNAGSVGTATVSSGTWANSDVLYVGWSGTGTLNITGGRVTNSIGYLGYRVGSVGTATVSSGTWANSGNLNVGGSGTGTLNIAGGSVNSSGGYVGFGVGSVGTAMVSSGTWSNTSELRVGDSGTGTLYVTGGRVTNSDAYLGVFVGSIGTATVSSGTWANSGFLAVGSDGAGTLNVNGGSVTDSDGYLGLFAGSIGTATVSSGTWANDGDLVIGSSGSGSLNVTGGSVTSSFGRLGSNSGSLGTATVSSGTWANSRNLTVGVSGTGTLTMTGGLMTIGGTLSRGTNGTINLNAGGTLQIGTGGTTGVLATNLTNNGTLVFNRSNNSTYSGTIGGNGSVVKSGAGVVQLTAVNTYAGPTSVLAGGLNLNGSIVGGLYVAPFASLSGTGTIAGATTIAGVHSPGNSPGVQTLTGGLTYTAGAAVNWELVANTTGSAGTFSDQIVLPTGNLVFSGSTALNLSFNAAGSAVNWADPFWAVDRAWLVYDLSAGTTTGIGNFSVTAADWLDANAATLSSARPGSTFSVGLSGQDVVLNYVAAVPEPGSLAIMAAAAVVGIGLRRRRAPIGRVSAILVTLAGVSSGPVHAAVTTYTSTFSGTIAAGDTALLTGTASVSGNVANSGTLQFNITGSSAVANNAIISGTGIVRMTGSGTVTNLFDAQTYTGATRLENGTLLVNYNDRLGNTSSGVIFDGGELQITNSGVVSTFSTARSMSLISAGTIDTSTLADGSYDQPAFTGVVSGTGTLTLAAHGLGNGASDAYLRFGGASTYTGTTRITSGMVYASSTTAFGSSTVVLDGGGLVAPSAVTVNNAIVLAGTANFVRPWSSQTMNLGGVISGTGGLQKTDNGTVNLNAANSYTGDTRIRAGTLNAANYAALAETTLDMNSADAGSIGFTVAQTGTYQIGGLTGSRAINNGGDTLAIGGNDATTTYSGTISGAGGLIKAGVGTLTLTGSNIYTGATTVSAGTLTIGGGGNGVLSIGNDGTGTLNVTGGSVTSGAGFLGSNAGSVGAATVSSGTWANGNSGISLVVGDFGTGTLDVTGGSVTNAMGILGKNSGGVGTATVSSGAWANGELLIVGNFGTGTLNVTGGSVTSASGELARNPGGVGTVTVSSGTWANSGNLSVGTTGIGTLNVTGGSVTNSFCELGYFPSGVGIATVSSGTWANRGNLTVGVSGTGTLTMSGGLVTVGGTLSRGTNGTINLNTGGTLQIGTGGTTGVLATNLTNDGTLVFNRSNNSTYSGTISGAGTVTKQGVGTLTLTGSNSYTGGTVLQGGALALGSAGAIGSTGTISFTGGTLQYSASNTTDYSARFSSAAGQDYSIDTNGQNVTFANPLNSSGGSLTKLGAGVLNLTGTEVAQNFVVLVLDFTTNVSAGGLQGVGGSGYLWIGHSGTGTLNVTGGSVTNTRGYLGYNAGSVGTATVSSGTWANSSDLIVGYRGTGTLNVTGGSVTNTFSYLGYNAGSAGSATVSSGTWANSGSLFVGHYSGPGTLNVTGGIVTNTNGSLGYNVGSVGAATVSSGTWANSGDLVVGNGGTATLTMSGGLVSVGGQLSRGPYGTINLNAGGTLQIGTGGPTGVLATDLTNNGTLVFNRSNNSTYSGTIGGNGSVTKQGAGTLTLAGVSTYSGLTWVREGTLAMGVSNAFAAASDLTVDSGATFDRAGFSQTVTDAMINGSVTNTGGGMLSVTGTLSGTGFVNGDVTVAGIHAPGNSPGTQTFSGDLTYSAGAAVNWELVANTTGSAGTFSDQILLPTGNLAFSGSTSLNLSFNAAGSTVAWSNPFWAVDRSWLVYDLSAGTTTGIGNFSVTAADWLDANAATLSSARPGSTFSVGLSGQDVVLNYVAAVPEPGALAIMAAAALVGLGLRRRAPIGRVSAILVTLAGVSSGPAHAAVTTYTSTFSGPIAAGDTALLTGTASVSGNVANSGTLQFNISGSSAVANNAIISGTGLVRMTGSGTVTNLFDAQTYTGATRLENGTLLVNYNDRLGNTSSGVTFDGGRLQITNSGVVSTFSTARSMSLVSAGTIDTSTLADGSYDQPAFTGPISGGGTLTLAANGLGNGASDAYLRLGGTSTYSGTTRITSGMVYASSTAAFGKSTVVLDGGGLVAPAAVMANNAIVLAGVANSVRAWSSQTMNLGGVISGTGGLQKTDNGTVNLNAANTYTGDTRIVAGTLNAANYAALASTTLDMQAGDTGSIGFTVAQTGTFQIGGLTGSRAINNGGDTLAIGGNDASTTYSGTLTGAGALVKTGIGTLTLTGNNSYSGGTVLQGGTLALGSAGAIGSVGTISFTGGTLQYSASNTTDYSARLSNADGQNYVIDTNGYNVAFGATLTSAGGSLTKLGSGTLSLPKDEDSDYLGLKNMSLEVVAGVASGPGTPDFYVTTGNRFNVSGGRFEGVTTTQIGSPGPVATGTISGGVVVTNIQVGSAYFGPAGGHVTFSGGRLDGNLTVGVGSNTTASSVVTGGTVGGPTAVHAIGVSGTGTLTMSGGRVRGNEFVVGSSAAGTGAVTVSGGTLAIGVSLLVGDGGIGSLSITDTGVVSVGGGSNYLQLGGLSSGAGILNIGTGGVAGTLYVSDVFRRPGTGTATVNFNHTESTTFLPALAGTMTVNKLGSGTTNLTAASTFSGTATVSAGEFKLNGSLGATSLVNVLSGGALSGTGTIAGATTIAGVHSPGNSPGTQTFTSDLTYTAGAAVNWELIANTTGSAGTLSDQIVLPTGNLAFSGSTAMNLAFNTAGSTVNWSDPFWAVDRAWLVYDLSAGTTTGIGNFSVTAADWLDANAATLSSARPGSTFSIGLTGQDVVLNYVAAVPEPAISTMVLAGVACAGALVRRRHARI